MDKLKKYEDGRIQAGLGTLDRRDRLDPARGILLAMLISLVGIGGVLLGVWVIGRMMFGW